MGGGVDGGYLDVGKGAEDVGLGQIWAVGGRGQYQENGAIVGVPYGGTHWLSSWFFPPPRSFRPSFGLRITDGQMGQQTLNHW